MATHDTTPIRELSDVELRKRLLVLGYDVPVSVNRDFLVMKLEKASAQSAGGGGGRISKKQQRHSMAVSPPSPPPSNSPARKRKSMAAGTPTMNSGGGRGHSQHHNNVSVSTPVSPLATSSPLPPGTPQNQYMGSPASSVGMSTPSTPSPFVSRLSTPSPPSSHHMNNGETGGSHSPRYLNYYNMFKASSSGGGGDGGGGSGDMGGGNYGYLYNRGIRMSASPGGSFNPVTSVAPPSRSDRNGYTAGGRDGGPSLGVETDWCGGHLISKVLLLSFLLFFAIIAGLYMSKSSAVDPRGLTSTNGDVSKGDNAATQVPLPPPTPVSANKKKEMPPPPTSMIYPICGLKGVDPEACIQKDVVKNSRKLFNELKDELTQRAKKIGCSNDIKEETLTLKDAKSKLYTLSDLRKGEVDSAFQGMLLLVTENPRGGLSLHSPDDRDIASKDVADLDLTLTKISATGVNPDFFCAMKAMFVSLILHISAFVALMGSGYFGWRGYKFYKTRKQSEQNEIYRMVERVLDLLRIQYEMSENSSQGTPFLAVNHIRDELLPPQERIRKDAFWNKVVNYISNHESRVREEIQHISGEEFKVWRWLPSASPLVSTKRFSTANSHHQQRSRFSMPGSPLMSSSPMIPPAGPSHTSMSPPASPPQQHKNLYPSLGGLSDDDGEDILTGVGGNGDTNSNQWQGQAFETCAGSPNALPTTPTTCLKIRHMFPEGSGGKERVRIERHILEKCSQAKILHIGIDSTSVDGCVYIRCLTKEDAGIAFKALHGWWFEGKLLSVKFLREERYYNRFPEAERCTLPLGLPR